MMSKNLLTCSRRNILIDAFSRNYCKANCSEAAQRKITFGYAVRAVKTFRKPDK